MVFLDDSKKGKVEGWYSLSEISEALKQDFDFVIKFMEGKNCNFWLRYKNVEQESEEFLKVLTDHGVFDNEQLLKTISLFNLDLFHVIKKHINRPPVSFKDYVNSVYDLYFSIFKEYLEWDFESVIKDFKEIDSLKYAAFFSDYQLGKDKTSFEQIREIFTKNHVFENPTLCKELASANEFFSVVIPEEYTGKQYFFGVILRIKNMYDVFSFVKEIKYQNKKLDAGDCRKVSRYLLKKDTDDYSISDLEYENIKECVQFGIPMEFIPLDHLSEDILDRFYHDKIINEEVYKVHKILNTTKLNYGDERKVLDILGFNSYKCIEDYIKDNQKKYVNSIQDKLLIKLYALKYANKNGIDDCKINAFEGVNYNSKGWYSYSKQDITIANDTYCSVKSIVSTLHHELNHAIQFNNMKMINFDGDEDILEYSKDILLRLMIGNEYYYDNYYSISYEFDADFKAKIENIKLFGDCLNNDYKEFDNNKQYLEKILKSSKYKREFNRDDISIGELFDKRIISFFIKSKDYEIKEFLKEIDEFFPVIKYEYDFKLNPPLQKDIKELVKLYFKSKGKDKKIYESILISRCNEYKSGKGAKENIEQIKSLLKWKRKKELLDVVIEKNKDTYLKYNKKIEELENCFVNVNKR